MVKKLADTGLGKAPNMKSVLFTVIIEANLVPTSAALDVANPHKDGKFVCHLLRPRV